MGSSRCLGQIWAAVCANLCLEGAYDAYVAHITY